MLVICCFFLIRFDAFWPLRESSNLYVIAVEISEFVDLQAMEFSPIEVNEVAFAVGWSHHLSRDQDHVDQLAQKEKAQSRELDQTQSVVS